MNSATFVKIFTRCCKYCNKEIIFDTRVKAKNYTLLPLNKEDRSIHDHPDKRGIFERGPKKPAISRKESSN